MDKVILSKITLLRKGDTTAYPLITLYPEWIKSQPRISYACEEEIGTVISPQLQFSVYFDSLPARLTEDAGGILHDYNAETEDILCQIYLDDNPGESAWLGNITHWIWSQGDQALVLGFAGGLETLRRFNLEDIVSGALPGNALWTEDQIGRFAKWLINQIYGNSDTSLLFPLIYDVPRLSYCEHPERRFCEGEDHATLTPTSYTRAMATDGTYIYACAQHHVLRYNPADGLWIYLGALTGMTAINGMDFQVIGLSYEAAVPQLRALVGHVPVSIVTGTSPNANHSQVYEVTFAL